MTSILSFVSTYLSTSVQIGLLIGVVLVVLFKIYVKRKHNDEFVPTEPSLPPMPKRDFRLEELRPYNGTDNPRILIAVNGKVFDVTSRKGFYGPGGPYSVFAGRDASRCLATFSIETSVLKDQYDDLSDLNSMQMESVLEWEMQFKEKYDYVGKLLKPGENHTNYITEESEEESKGDNFKKTD